MQPDIPTKSSIMVGLGETREDLIEAMDDLRANNVDILTLGQYLQPSKKHLPVLKYYPPAEFAELKEIALSKGFSHCEAGTCAFFLPCGRASTFCKRKTAEAK